MQQPVICRWIAATLVSGIGLTPHAPADDSDASSQTAGSRVVATWSGGQLTEEELERWQAYRGNPGDDEPSAASRADAIRELAFSKSLAEIATREGLVETRRVRLELEAMRRRVLAPILRREVMESVSATDEEVEALRRNHPEAFQKPRKLKLRNIYKSFGGSAESPPGRDRMREIYAELVAGADFEDVARRESESQSAPRGGALGWVDPNELPSPVAEVVRLLTPGQISPPIEHGRGLSIFLCEDVQDARNPTVEEVRAKLRTLLVRRQGRKAWEAYQKDLLESASTRVDPGSTTIVLELPGYRLDAQDLKALRSLQATRTGVAPGAEQMGELLRSWALGVLEVQQAVERGLDRRPETAEALHWGRMETLAQAELARRIQAELPEPSDDDLRCFFEDHRRLYRQPAAYDLGLIDFGQSDGRADVERAVSVARRVASGVLRFEEAARRYSTHPSAGAGGGIGWKARHQIALWGPTASSSIFLLRPGETTPLLHLDSGLKMFTLRATREARALPFDEVEARVRTAWLERQLPEIEAAVRRHHLEAIGLAIRSTASPSPRIIRWSTATEFETYGYDVYRGQTPEGPFQRLTEEPIPGAGTTDLPRSYRYEDATAAPGELYFYYVEAISTSGHRRRLTPVRPSKGETP